MPSPFENPGDGLSPSDATAAQAWEVGWRNAQSLLEKSKHAVGDTSVLSIPVQRVNILEAAVLDDEIFALLESAFAAAFLGGEREAERTAGPGSSAAAGGLSWRRLLSFGLRSVIASATILANKPTPGQALQNMRYRNERMFRNPRTSGLLRVPGDALTTAQRASWVVLNVLVPFVWPHLRHFAVRWTGRWIRSESQWDTENLDSNPPPPQLKLASLASSCKRYLFALLRSLGSEPEVAVVRLLDFLESMWSLARLANVIVFMRQGVYATLIERLLCMRQVPTQPGGTRALSFDYQNRQLVFSEINDFALYILPLIRVHSTIRAARRYAARYKARIQRLGRHMGWLSAYQSADQDESEARALDMCAWCETNPAQTPYVVSCGCTFCYYCLRTRVDPVPATNAHPANSGCSDTRENDFVRPLEAACPSCGKRIRWSRRWERVHKQNDE